MLAELFGIRVISAEGWGKRETIHAIELIIGYQDYLSIIFPQKYCSTVHQEINPEQMATLNALAERCIDNMGDIFYDPEDCGDYDWGINDDGSQTIESETANERLKNRAIQCVVETMAEAIALYASLKTKDLG